jgi:uncharacterized protein YdhG (YjbR/CyaY superfamily)
MTSDKPLKSGYPLKIKNYASFAEWESDMCAINELTAVVSNFVCNTEPSLQKSVKWGQGCFSNNGLPIIYIHTEPDHI